MSTLAVDNIQPATPGNETYFLNKAWINFDGTGTISIRASGNVSSITDGGTGDYTVTFANAFADANYGYGALCKYTGTGTGNTSASVEIAGDTDPDAASINVWTKRGSTINDMSYVGLNFNR